MRKWGIGIWLLVALIAAGAGLLGTWYFRDRMQVGWSQLLGVGISGTTLAFVGTVRKETMRWQDNRMRRIDNSDKVIDFYNREVRELVTTFLTQFEAVMRDQRQQNGWHEVSESIKQDFADLTASRLGLATILHLIDKIAWLLDQHGYLESTEILAAIGSETSRLLVSEEYEPIIRRMLRQSSLSHIQSLMTTLKGAKSHDERH